MLKRLLLALILVPAIATAHPSIGIVSDSRGNIFYTDLHQVWKISGGKQTVAVPDMHTHELYIDSADNLYGEHQWNDESGTHFYHYLWRLSPAGRLDTVVSNRPAFVNVDFSLARDGQGNEYYLKPGYYLKPNDTSSIIRRSPAGLETALATGRFKGISWLHPHTDGSVVYVLNNTVYRIGTDGATRIIAKGIASKTPSYTYFGNGPIVYGAWQDIAQNVYVAAFSDQVVKKVDGTGTVSVFYKSSGRWAPTHGVFDKEGRLWVLECSDKNEIRAVQAPIRKREGSSLKNGAPKRRGASFLLGLAAIGVVAPLALYGMRRAKKRRATGQNP
jgi:hypothetical protein